MHICGMQSFIVWINRHTKFNLDDHFYRTPKGKAEMYEPGFMLEGAGRRNFIWVAILYVLVIEKLYSLLLLFLKKGYILLQNLHKLNH